MTVTPAGLPAWSRTADFSTYGGHTDKKNYQAQGVVNPRTDVSAEQFASLVADAAAVSRTADFAVVTFTCRDSTTDDPTLDSYLGMHGVGAAAAPTLTRISDGLVELQWDATYTDPYGVSQAVNITGGGPQAHGSTALAPTLELIDARTVRVHIKNMSDAYVQDKKITLTVTTGGD